ncbi:aldolase/citrate lyase family protein, partial [Burkholderia sp. Cy-637]
MTAPMLKASLGDPADGPRFGVFCSTPAPLTIELIAAAGYDFAIVDLEHTLIDGATLTAMLLAARASGLAVLVRVAALAQVAPALDQGAQGIVVPRVRSIEEARRAVLAARHAPLGERGLNAT